MQAGEGRTQLITKSQEQWPQFELVDHRLNCYNPPPLAPRRLVQLVVLSHTSKSLNQSQLGQSNT